ncbi:MAG: UDP-N-acetylglucosamine 2-epimerase (non-hydrolyzing) [Candidatus Mcinerneyibacterium aminivorans]|uniref:UDP-N-acetylglucosamine 2-epimerase (Non-hydrolyzing) n=1 Tax=Candidatus Mcinerneyibacterium aminivorans TaxID=2703815 RepID=A0A5D0MDW3_9BACT|nr:MAG: UDP-N-acetylglucosamine 2-epimerase (non-hydrolyzing) [Candidatus Mcinerneyibacterium aminivorans]
MELLFVVGARPQFIKIAPILRTIKKNYSEKIDFKILHTGQHYDKNMSDVFFDELKISKPDKNLKVGSGSHTVQMSKMLEGCENYISKIKPDKVIVFGDTNSTLAGTLAASNLKIPVVHIEAGLRSFNMSMPEEKNRILTDHLSSYLFCPTDKAVDNLKREGIYNKKKLKGMDNEQIIVIKCGDIMIDMIRLILKDINNTDIIIKNYPIDKNKYILATIHRESNTDNIFRFKKILNLFNQIEEKILLLAHPRTKKIINEYNIKIPNNVLVKKPVGYEAMVILEKNSKYIFTDSGGIQKEAYFLKKLCLTLRDETEWQETVDLGWNIIGFNDKYNTLLDAYKELKKRENKKLNHPEIYGKINSSKKIIEALLN